MDVQFKNVSIDKYTIDDIMFNVLFFHYIGHLSESRLAIGTLVPLGLSDNQTCYMYVVPDFLVYQTLQVSSKQAFSHKINYFYKPYFIWYFFSKYKWKVFGLYWYEQGMIHVTKLTTHKNKDKQGLGFKGP